MYISFIAICHISSYSTIVSISYILYIHMFCLKHVFMYICKVCKCVCHRNMLLVRWAAHEDPKLAKTLLCDSGVLCGIFVCFRGHLEKETLKLRCCWCRIDVSWSSVRKGSRFHDDSKNFEMLRSWGCYWGPSLSKILFINPQTF